MSDLTFEIEPDQVIVVVSNYKLVLSVTDVSTAEQVRHTLMHLASQIEPLIEDAILTMHEEELTRDRH